MVPQTDPQHCVTAGCHPLPPGHTCGPGDAPGVLGAHCCSHLSCRGSQLLGQGGLIFLPPLGVLG